MQPSEPSDIMLDGISIAMLIILAPLLIPLCLLGWIGRKAGILNWLEKHGWI